MSDLIILLIQVEHAFKSNRAGFREDNVVFLERIVLCEVNLLAQVHLTHHDGQFGDLNWLSESREHLQCQLVKFIDLDPIVLEAGPRPH